MKIKANIPVIITIVGPSGSGKSFFMNSVMRIVTYTLVAMYATSTSCTSLQMKKI